MHADTIVTTCVPAASALLGVGMTLLWSSRQERMRQRADANRALWDARRIAVAQLVVAVNQAIDSTRKAIAESSTPSEATRLDSSRERPWAHAFECYLEAGMLLPAAAEQICADYLQRAYSWRRLSVSIREDTNLDGHHEQLISRLRPWLSPG